MTSQSPSIGQRASCHLERYPMSVREASSISKFQAPARYTVIHQIQNDLGEPNASSLACPDPNFLGCRGSLLLRRHVDACRLICMQLQPLTNDIKAIWAKSR